jgi:polysaccharide pyruvyl transferase WcaK-like protein
MRDVAPTGIGLLDAMGHGNLGDAAIQDSVIENIRKRLPHARIIGFSFVPGDTAKRHGIACFPLTRHSSATAGTASSDGDAKANLMTVFRKVPGLRALARSVKTVLRESVFLVRSYRILRSIDLLIISGGGQLGDLWGGPWGHPCTLFKFSLLAKLAGKRLYFLNVGAEALEYPLSRFFSKSALQLAEYVSFRDADSQKLVQNLGVTSKTYVCADSAYALDSNAYVNGTSHSPSCRVVGINPMGYCDPRVWPRKDQSIYEAYLEKLTRFSEWLLEEGYSPKIFPTSPEVDKYAIADLEQRLLEGSGSRGSTAPGCDKLGESVTAVFCESVEDVLREMSGCDFILTSKYHGVVFSQLLKKPVIALGYHAKVEAAMRGAGHERFYADIEDFENAWLVNAFLSIVRGRDDLQSQEASATAGYAEILRKQFDGLFSGAESGSFVQRAGSGSRLSAVGIR